MQLLTKIWRSFVSMFGSLFVRKKIDVLAEEALNSPSKMITKRFFKNKLAVVGIFGFVIIFIFSFGLSLFLPSNFYYTNTLLRNLPPNLSYLSVPDQLIRDGVKSIEPGSAYTVGLSNQGDLYFWGSDNRGISQFPANIKNVDIEILSAGSQHIAAIGENGETFLWGYNHQGQSEIPSRLTSTFAADPIVRLYAGLDRTFAITEDNFIYVWGTGTNPLIGGSMIASPYSFMLGGVRQKPIKLVSNGSNAIVLLENNMIRLFGEENQVLLNIPEELTSGVKEVVDIAITQYNAFAVTSDGQVYAWGDTSFGLIGDSIPIQGRTNVKAIQSGFEHILVLLNDGKVIAWGDNQQNQTNVPSSASNTVQIFAGGYYNYALQEDGSVVAWGLRGFLFGSDEQGRDFFTQVVHGGQITLTVGAVAVIISLIIGITVGLVSGFFGGWIDNMLMRFTEIVSSFPFLPFAITLSSLLIGQEISEINRMLMIMVILGILSWTGLARLIRGLILSERERDYVLASRALGIKNKNIIVRHILPSVMAIVIVNATLGYAGSLLTEAGLSFLGFGVQKPNPSWGNILTAAQKIEVIQLYWWRWVIPGILIIWAALSVNLIGDAMRDAIDPRNAER